MTIYDKLLEDFGVEGSSLFRKDMDPSIFMLAGSHIGEKWGELAGSDGVRRICDKAVNIFKPFQNDPLTKLEIEYDKLDGSAKISIVGNRKPESVCFVTSDFVEIVFYCWLAFKLEIISKIPAKHVTVIPDKEHRYNHMVAWLGEDFLDDDVLGEFNVILILLNRLSPYGGSIVSHKEEGILPKETIEKYDSAVIRNGLCCVMIIGLVFEFLSPRMICAMYRAHESAKAMSLANELPNFLKSMRGDVTTFSRQKDDDEDSTMSDVIANMFSKKDKGPKVQ